MMKYTRLVLRLPAVLSLCLLLWSGARARARPPPKIAATPFYPAKLAEMDAAINQAIADKKCPGGVLWLEHRGVELSQGLRATARWCPRWSR